MTAMAMTVSIEAETVSDMLKMTRGASGLTTREIGAKVGVSHNTVSNWERGNGEPSASQFVLWAQATSQAPEQMFQGLMDLCARRDSNPQPSDP